MIELKDSDVFKPYKDVVNLRSVIPKAEPIGPNNGLYLKPIDDCSTGIIVQSDEVMTQIYWQDGKWEWMHTHDLNSAINVEIL